MKNYKVTPSQLVNIGKTGAIHFLKIECFLRFYLMSLLLLFHFVLRSGFQMDVPIFTILCHNRNSKSTVTADKMLAFDSVLSTRLY